MDFKKLVNSSGNVNCNYTNTTKSETILIYVTKLLKFFEEPSIKEKMSTEPQSCIHEAFEKFNEFFMQYPTLAKLISEDPYHFDMDRLLKMLNLKNKVANKEVSYKNASTGLGSEYYDEYVKPNLPSNDK
jgi:hypothetical protein